MFRGLVKAALKGLNDKVASVFFNAIPLVRGLFTSYASEASARDVQTSSGEIIGALLERGLSDSNARVQAASSETLQWLAEKKEVGPAAVAGPLLRPVKSQVSALQTSLVLSTDPKCLIYARSFLSFVFEELS